MTPGSHLNGSGLISETYLFVMFMQMQNVCVISKVSVIAWKWQSYDGKRKQTLNFLVIDFELN